jgi:hypothetical protein
MTLKIKFAIPFVLSVILMSCSSRSNPDIKILYDNISTDNLFNRENIELGDHLFPKRYSSYYKSYINIHNQISQIIEQIDSTKELSFSKYLQHADTLKTMLITLTKTIQEINCNDSSLIIFYNDRNQPDSVYATGYLDNLLMETNTKLLTANKKTYKQNLDFCKLNLALIYKDVLYTLNRLVATKTFPVNYIDPVIIKKPNSVDCYITSIDTEAKNFIIIGKFNEIFYNGNIFYKTIKPFDTVFLDKAKAEISNNIFYKGDAVLFITLPDGSKLQRKLKK